LHVQDEVRITHPTGNIFLTNLDRGYRSATWTRPEGKKRGTQWARPAQLAHNGRNRLL
jgi:hypothetical protein